MRKLLAIGIVLAAAAIVTVPALAQRASAGCERWDVDTVVTLDGKLMEVEPPMALFQSEGKTYLLHLGPLWYANEVGFAPEAGDRLRVTGQISGPDESPSVYPHTIVRDGRSFVFASEDGVPAWARGGRGRAGRDGGPAKIGCPRPDCPRPDCPRRG